MLGLGTPFLAEQLHGKNGDKNNKEKYHYEVLRNNIFKPCEMQSLLIPEVIKVTPAILVQLDDINQMLVEDFLR